MRKEIFYFAIGIFFFFMVIVALIWEFKWWILNPLFATLFALIGALFLGTSGDLSNRRINMKNLRKKGYSVDNPKEYIVKNQFIIEKIHSYDHIGRPCVEAIIVDKYFNFIRNYP